MNAEEASVEAQYHRPQLFEQLVAKWREAGIPDTEITTARLSTSDQFHVRGLAATRELAAMAGLQPGMQVLDAGCGIGGPARLLAEEYAVQVTGIDITGEYIRTARLLSALTGLDHATTFVQGSATQMPFANGQFDLVWTQHAQMNIADKASLYAEMTRVLRKQGRLLYYDVLAQSQQPLRFPVPWAEDAGLSFLITNEQLIEILEQNGLKPLVQRNVTEAGIRFFEENGQATGPGPVAGLELLLGPRYRNKLENLWHNLKEGHIRLQSGIWEKTR